MSSLISLGTDYADDNQYWKVLGTWQPELVNRREYDVEIEWENWLADNVVAKLKDQAQVRSPMEQRETYGDHMGGALLGTTTMARDTYQHLTTQSFITRMGWMPSYTVARYHCSTYGPVQPLARLLGGQTLIARSCCYLQGVWLRLNLGRSWP